MTKIEEIEEAVSGLPPKDLAKFRAWFEAFDAERFDEQIERDVRAGKLDAVAEEAVRDLKSGNVRDI
jgi:hypothetical protein